MQAEDLPLRGGRADLGAGPGGSPAFRTENREWIYTRREAVDRVEVTVSEPPGSLAPPQEHGWIEPPEAWVGHRLITYRRGPAAGYRPTPRSGRSAGTVWSAGLGVPGDPWYMREALLPEWITAEPVGPGRVC